ncbi:Slx4p interacting protein [Recurvomyces mirabilis]|nr:Slx4p interacting protein [Recurvomyces mirabilis]
MDKPIPAFYACYLLRSTVRHQSLYVGSTPHPVRRRNQHNGKAAGGAHRTSKDSLRPWEMTCLVTGFPSKIAALQFEWAWQNTHLTRHVTADDRLTQAKSNIRVSPKSGRVKKRPARPRMGITERLGNLHLLLRSSSFERWPLNVTFYAQDVFRVWERWARQHIEHLRPGIEVRLDPSTAAKKDQVVASGDAAASLTGIAALDIGYNGLKSQLEKAKGIFEDGEWLQCACCQEAIVASGDMTLVCITEGCNSVFHLDCLSTAFLEAEGDEDAMVPTSGACPSCGLELRWVDLAKELSLRMRGEAEISALYKKRRKRKDDGGAIASDAESDGDIEDSDQDDIAADADDWHELPESSDDEPLAMRCEPGPAVAKKKRKLVAEAPVVITLAPSERERIIEESDWEDAAVIT